MGDNTLIELLLTRYNNWETEFEKEEYIDKLETFLNDCNKYMNTTGDALVPDAIYDTCMDYLRNLKPDSSLLHTVWSVDDENASIDEDLDRFLVAYPMMSIQTIKHLSDKGVRDFHDRLPVGEIEVVASMKENGHAIRVVWKDGYLVQAHSRGRSTKGKDLTRQMKLILGEYCQAFEELGLVEMRGEALLPFENLPKAREFNPTIKSAFSGVASMMRESASEDETKLLHVVFYDIMSDELEFDYLSDKYAYIVDSGFEAPLYKTYTVNRRSLEEDIKSIVSDMDILSTDYEYYTDGVVITVDNIFLFIEFGAEDKYRYGNLAMKVGRWSQDGYQGVIKDIQWVNGKTKKTPVAILEEGVLTATGNTVTNVPLYAPCYILLLEAYPGNTIHFRYGGESGVIPIDQQGRLVTDLKLNIDL